MVNTRYRTIGIVTALGCMACAAPASAQQPWVQFNNQTSQRIVITTPDIAGDPVGVTSDNQEKDFAWGDVNQDGWTDLVVVRKQPFTSAGKRRNILLMNENGVLTDRTAQYATLSDVSGDQGFYTATNDRDVFLTDVNLDGWLDIVTATTISDGNPKHIGHPRVYINLGEVEGVWQGFRHEDARVPQMASASGQMTFNPRFCSVAAGDVTGDGYPDLYFGDYDSSGAGGVSQPAGADFNNKLLVNLGAANPGYFVDQSVMRMGSSTGTILNSAFGAASIIADINNNGLNDVVKQTSLNAPQHVAVAYNTPGNVGFFTTPSYSIVNQQAPYFVSAGDLNNDGRLDLVVTDDNADRFLLNQGPNGQGIVNFTSHTFSFSGGSGDQGFGSQSVVADLDGDGWSDVIISDVDVDIGGCNRRAQIYRNLGGVNGTPVGGTPVLQEQVSGGSVASIPTSQLTGTHNTAVFDINNDGTLDIVFGRCNGYGCWMNLPQLSFGYPSGRPAEILPGVQVSFPVTFITGGTVLAGSEMLHVSIDGGVSYTQYPLAHQSGNTYLATLPEAQCGPEVKYYISGQLSNGTSFTDPPTAPGLTFSAIVTTGLEVTLYNEFEESVAEWTVVNDPALTAGAWEQAFPIPTLYGGQLAAPGADASVKGDGQCFVSQNAAFPGQSAGFSDVDGGPSYLISPTLDVGGNDAIITYRRWFHCNTAGTSTQDFLRTSVSNNNGATWVQVHQTNGTGGQWQQASFRVSDFVAPTNQVRVRFAVSDQPNDSITNGAIDNFQVEQLACETDPKPTPCPGDIAPDLGDGQVNVDDLLFLLGAWGNKGGPADLNDDTLVNVDDLLILLGGWGVCK